MKLVPLQDRLVVKMTEIEETTKSGLILTGSAKEKPQAAEIISIGPDVKLNVKVGDKILFAKWSGTEVKIEGEERLIMKESDILGVIEK